jgi:hypothetical protein
LTLKMEAVRSSQTQLLLYICLLILPAALDPGVNSTSNRNEYQKQTNNISLWYSSHSSRLQIQRSAFDSFRYQIFWEIVRLERGPLCLVSTTQELLGRKSSGSGLEIREHGRMDPPLWPRDTFSIRKRLALTSLTSGGRSIGIVRPRTQDTEFVVYIYIYIYSHTHKVSVLTWGLWLSLYNFHTKTT